MLPEINLTHLRYFYDAVQLGGISQAASENYVSQSAISQAIVKLEQTLQSALSTHQRHSFRLTEEGKIVFEEAKAIFSSVERLKERLKALSGEISGTVVFACTNALAQFFLPEGYLKMREKYPKVRLKFHRGSLRFIHEALRQEKVSFALALNSKEFQGYESEPLFRGTFRLYIAKGAKKGEGIFVDHEENEEVAELKRRYAAHYHKELVIQEALSGWALCARFVEMGIGMAYLPDFIYAGTKAVQEVKLDIAPIEYQISAFWLKGTPLSRAPTAFLEELKLSYLSP